jgi:hypothetical protein
LRVFFVLLLGSSAAAEAAAAMISECTELTGIASEYRRGTKDGGARYKIDVCSVCESSMVW